MAWAGLLKTLIEPAMATNEMDKLSKTFNSFFILLLESGVNICRTIALPLASNDCLHLLRMNGFPNEQIQRVFKTVTLLDFESARTGEQPVGRDQCQCILFPMRSVALSVFAAGQPMHTKICVHQ